MAIDEPTKAPAGFFDPKRPMELRRQAVLNLWDFLVRGGIADLTSHSVGHHRQRSHA